MPRIDPQQLLNTLGVLLAPNGGIKSAHEVSRLVALMHKFSRKLVSKCIYVQILKSTNPDLLDLFLDETGWDLLNAWFSDAINSKNWPFCVEMIQLFAMCPISADRLKDKVDQNMAPKLINTLRQETHIDENVRILAGQVYDKWVQVVSPVKVAEEMQQSDEENSASLDILKSYMQEVSDNLKKEDSIKAAKDQKQAATSPLREKKESSTASSSSRDSKDRKSSSSSSSHKNSSRDKDVDRKRRREKERDKERKRFRPDRRDEVDEEEKRRIKEVARRLKEEEQNKKDKETLKKLSGGSTAAAVGKMPKIPKKASDSAGTEHKKKSSGGLSFEEMMGGLDSKPKTVKTPLNKNKTAAMLEGLSKSSPSSKSKSDNSSSHHSSSHKRDHHHSSHHYSTSSSSHHHSSSSSHHHHSSHHKKDGTSPGSHRRSSSPSTTKVKPTITLPEKHSLTSRRNSDQESPKLKMSSPHTVHEDTGFANALSMKYEPRVKKRRRLSELDDKAKGKDKADSKKEEKEEEKPSSPTVPSFSFYRDTLEENTNDQQEEKTASPTRDGSTSPSGQHSKPLNKTPSPEASPKKAALEDSDMPFQEPDEELPREVKGILVYHRGQSKRNKSIQWRAETDLVETRYFEIDEGERVNVHKIKFERMREAELQMEKAALKSKAADVEEPTLQWYTPVRIEVEKEDFIPGAGSLEKEVQANREKNVLQALYFTKEMIPHTPAEADTEAFHKQQVMGIPLEDTEGGEDSDYVYTKTSWPTPKVNQVDHQASLAQSFSLPPALSNLLSSMGNNLQNILPTPGELSKEEQDTLAAQTQAMKAMGMLPEGSNNQNNAMNRPPPSMNKPPPSMNQPPPGFNMAGERNESSNAGYSTGNMNKGPNFNGPPPPMQMGYPGGPPPRMGAMPPPQRPNGKFGGGGPPPHHGHGHGFRPDRGGFHQNGRGFYGNTRGGPYNRGGFHRDNRGGGTKYKTRPCSFYNGGNGYCRDGDQCNFIHDQATGN